MLACVVVVDFERLVRVTLKTFAYNVGLQLVLHPFLPLAFVTPAVLGAYTGWTIRATVAEGVWVGVLMATYMTGLVLVIGVPFLFWLNLGDKWWIVPIIAAFVVAHVGLFAGGGAVVAGHYARKEPITEP
jgi:hypothetical protein